MTASSTRSAGRLVVVGSGGRAYREYSFRSLHEDHTLSAVLPAEPTWQRRYLDSYAVADLSDPVAIADAVLRLAGPDPRPGSLAVLTWDETAVEATAEAAAKLGVPHLSPEAARHCRDKYATRSLMARAGLAAVRYHLVTTVDEAVAAAADLGYPVVLKPRALAGSIGVTRADDEREVRAAFELADGAAFATLPTGHGVLVEEYLDGPEISVDSAVHEGDVDVVHIARKRLGFAPYFEEVGHLVAARCDEAWAGEVRELVVAAHRVLGVTTGVTHAEVRLTSRGPRLIELNARLGGDLIPFISALATGVDLVKAAAELAFGRRPDTTPVRQDTAEIRFLYPAGDGRARLLDLSGAAATAGISHASVIAEPGDRLLLPPRQAIPRLAALVAVGADEAECAAALDRAAATVDRTVDPLPEHVVVGAAA
ncbi:MULTISPECIES: ATP-grasp domain-containing protein [Streptomyces]|uniref:ATP-grasp domain-containing protein n=1 Tax=Streptomyces TaxID=1883 RepID=UPI00140A8545|nr:MULTISPECIES: ATP-grasp domain-containing protein [Streptomyces]MDH6226756.1 biotin carboxylase [Streptomyces sp. MJP52]